MLLSSDEPMCRICYDDEPKSDLISPCDCKGSMKYVHRGCLNDWLVGINNKACSTCKVEMTRSWAGFKPHSQWVAALRLEDIRRQPLHYLKRFALAFFDSVKIFWSMTIPLLFMAIWLLYLPYKQKRTFLRVFRIGEGIGNELTYLYETLQAAGVDIIWLEEVEFREYIKKIEMWQFIFKEPDLIINYMTFCWHLGMHLGLLGKYVFDTISIYEWTRKKKRNRMSWPVAIGKLIFLAISCVIFCLYPSYIVIFVSSFLFYSIW